MNAQSQTSISHHFIERFAKKIFLANGQDLAENNFFMCQFCGVKPKVAVMNIDRMEFTAWMDRIMERFDILMDVVNTSKNQRTAVDGEELLDSQDVLQMLKISARSLQRYRSSGKLPYYTISGKIYYKLSDIHQLVRESFTAPVPKRKPASDK
ncbi:3-mercaptopyruvate sulfurtransferase SseA [Flavobacterium piscis]|uniref:3-mercaptopyruvate sulfurtransferase SseA n=2 Tax=Flavobacteriaceae TaxID=49546 RepID=A0ABU1Y3L3_9FLAO|nr:3-mercaptopyruvate sulfurtransferase SseA [Flavobacterium piscis]